MKRFLWFLASAVAVGSMLIPIGNNPPLYRLLWYPFSPISHAPSLDGEYLIRSEGVSDNLAIYIDSLGVPHIDAATEEDAAFGIGLVQARDRLFQIEMVRRSVLGRIAEVAGEAAFDSDRFWRKFHFEQGAQRAMEWIEQNDPDQFAIYQAYADGINTYIAEYYHRERPPEFILLGFDPMPFEPWHIILLIKAMAKDLCYREDDLGFSQAAALLPEELLEYYYPWESPRAFPIFPELALDGNVIAEVPRAGEPAVIPLISKWEAPVFTDDSRAGLGSNNWAVSGSKTAQGHSFMCNDTHLKLRLPGTWYEMNIQVGAARRRGMSIPGAPFIISGYTDSVSWGMTNATWDLTDFYRFQLSPTGDSARLDNQWMAFDVYYDTIFVKGASTRILKNRMTPFGPLDTLHGNLVATQWNAQQFGNEGAAFQKLQNAGNWDEAAAALQHFSQPPQNFILADYQGNIGLITGGLAMRHETLRRGIHLATSLKDTATYFHTGSILREKNPSRGWSGSANQNHVMGGASAHFSYRYAPTGRGRRLDALLSDTAQLSREDMRAMQMDAVDMEWAWLREAIIREVPENWKSEMQNWDGSCDTSSVAATLFVLMKEFAAKAFYRRLPENLQWYPDEEWLMHQIAMNSPIALPKGEHVTPSQLLREAANETENYLLEQVGESKEKWEYGKLHQTHIEHMARIEPWNAAPFASMGSNRTLNVAKGMRVTHGASMRTLIEWTPEGPVAEMSVTGGQSGRPGHRNYEDQLPHFRSGFRHPAPLLDASRENARAVAKYIIKP